MTPLTRRQALAAVAAAPLALRAAPAGAAVTGDAAVLMPVLRVERFSQGAYTAAQLSGSPEVRDIARRFKAHEDQHVAALMTTMEALGAPKAPPLAGEEALDRAAEVLGIAPVFSELRGPKDLLAFLVDTEERLLAAWIRAHRGLSDASLVQTATQVLACQAQHLVVLREALGREPLPSALDAGRS